MKMTKYKIYDNDVIILKELGFKHIGEGVYVYEFPGYKWKGFTTITCKFTAFDDKKDILVDVLAESGDFYAPFYTEEKDNQVLKIVNSKIEEQLIKCGISKTE